VAGPFPLGRPAQLEIRAADPHMARIEEVHMIALHITGACFMDTER
jgi:hypothetical protein